MTPESNALNLAQSAFEAVCKERDEALAKLSTVRRWVEKNLSGGFVDSLTHLQNLECVADDWYGRLVETIRERDEARRNAEVERLSGVAVVAMCKRQESEIEAMREAITEVFNSFADEPASDSAWLLDDRQTAALTKLQPFIKP